METTYALLFLIFNLYQQYLTSFHYDIKQKSQERKGSGDGSEEEGPRVKELRKICRAVGIVVTNARHMAGCSSDNQKINKLKQLLREAGMEGRTNVPDFWIF